MKIVVDYDECASNAVCMGIAPEVFEVRDDGFLYVLNEHPGEDQRESVRQAANGCPTGAITGPRSEPHSLDPAKCIKCRSCYEICRFDAIAGDAIVIES